MKQKQRLDLLLCERGLAESRAKAQALIMAGEVFVSGQKLDKPGTAVDAEAPVELRGSGCPYVSRGGLKLEKALREFGDALGVDARKVTAKFDAVVAKYGTLGAWRREFGCNGFDCAKCTLSSKANCVAFKVPHIDWDDEEGR